MEIDDSTETPKAKRGFAAMDAEKQKEIAARGGKKAHEKGKAHTFTSKEAKEAGSKGGTIAAARKRKKKAKRAV
jgi:hypothetical protein